MLAQKEMIERLQQNGLAPGGGAPDQLMDMIRREMEMWRKVVAAAGIKAN